MVKKVQLGRTELYVNPIGFGANAVGGHNLYPNLDEAEGRELVHTVLQQGVNFIDTAFIYGPKRSEELIGEVVKEQGNRAETIIATKAAHRLNHEGEQFNNNPTFLKTAVDEALGRLQTDYIDLFYIHFPDKDTPKDEAVGALKELKDAGKIRAIGVSNFSLQQLQEANKDGYVDVVQGEYNLLSRDAEHELFPYLKEQQISFVPYFPLASGLLTGKFNEQATFDDLRRGLPYFQNNVFSSNLAKIEQLRPMAAEKNIKIAHLVLAWYLTREVIDVIIPGAKRAEQLLMNLETLNVPLTDKEIQVIDTIFNK